MTPTRRTLARCAAVLLLSTGAAACSGFRTPLPSLFHKSDKSARSKATTGQRIPVLSQNETLEPSAVLKGVDFSIPPAQPVTEWPAPGGTPAQSVEHVDAARNFSIAFRRKIGVGTSRAYHILANPVAAEGRLYVIDGQGSVFALDPASGREVWKVNFTPKKGRDREAFGGGVAYADGTLYVTSGFRFVAALDAKTGQEKWRTPTEAPMHGAPNVAGGKVYAINVNDELTAFDAQTGQSVWTYQAIAEPARILEASSVAITPDVVVAPFASGELVALNPVNGNDLWNDVLSLTNRNNALSEIRDIGGRPIIYRGDVLAGSHAGVFAAVDLHTGQRRWSLPIATVTTPWAAGDVVYITDQAGDVICVARDSGQIYWINGLNKRLRKKFRTIWSSPILAGDHLILVSRSGVALALDPKTGAEQKRLRLNAPAFVAPIALNGAVYVWTDTAELVAIR